MHESHIQYSRKALSCVYHAYMNFEQISSDWLRFMRGKRSQRSYSKRLGYSSNIA